MATPVIVAQPYNLQVINVKTHDFMLLILILAVYKSKF